MPRPDLQTLPAAESLYQELLVYSEQVKSLRGTARIRIRVLEKKVRLDAVIICDRKGRLRLEVLDFLDHVIFLVLLRNDRFLIYSVPENSYLEEPADSEQFRKTLGIPLSGKELIALLLGSSMFSPVTSPRVGIVPTEEALMLHVELVTLWDLMRLKLGKDPEFGIPLFNGLSRTQIHYIIMAGTLKKIAAGEVLFHKGDPSDSMCAIISGTMDVVEPESDDEKIKEHGIYKQLNQAGEGDVLGEMGLLRGVPRSATVIATQPCDYLEINLKMIKRLQWLYPPTANRFFMNLMTILCDRIEAVTNHLACESIVDDLTGWYNRRGFISTLETEIHRSRRYREHLALCLMGIDLEVSDQRKSFEIKDRNFRLIGQTLSTLIRKSDVLGRLDAETFALLLPQTSAQKAEPVCNRLRNLLMMKKLEDDGICLDVTLSIVELDHQSQETAVQMINRSRKHIEDRKR